MHVFPGLNYFMGWEEQFWRKNYTDAFLDILAKYEDDIKLVSGAHIHRSEFRAPISKAHEKIDVPYLITPSITPVYNNNPGYTVMEIQGD